MNTCTYCNQPMKLLFTSSYCDCQDPRTQQARKLTQREYYATINLTKELFKAAGKQSAETFNNIVSNSPSFKLGTKLEHLGTQRQFIIINYCPDNDLYRIQDLKTNAQSDWSTEKLAKDFVELEPAPKTSPCGENKKHPYLIVFPAVTPRGIIMSLQAIDKPTEGFCFLASDRVLAEHCCKDIQKVFDNYKFAIRNR